MPATIELLVDQPVMACTTVDVSSDDAICSDNKKSPQNVCTHLYWISLDTPVIRGDHAVIGYLQVHSRILSVDVYASCPGNQKITPYGSEVKPIMRLVHGVNKVNITNDFEMFYHEMTLEDVNKPWAFFTIEPLPTSVKWGCPGEDPSDHQQRDCNTAANTRIMWYPTSGYRSKQFFAIYKPKDNATLSVEVNYGFILQYKLQTKLLPSDYFVITSKDAFLDLEVAANGSLVILAAANHPHCGYIPKICRFNVPTAEAHCFQSKSINNYSRITLQNPNQVFIVGKVNVLLAANMSEGFSVTLQENKLLHQAAFRHHGYESTVFFNFTAEQHVIMPSMHSMTIQGLEDDAALTFYVSSQCLCRANSTIFEASQRSCLTARKTLSIPFGFGCSYLVAIAYYTTKVKVMHPVIKALPHTNLPRGRTHTFTWPPEYWIMFFRVQLPSDRSFYHLSIDPPLPLQSVLAIADHPECPGEVFQRGIPVQGTFYPQIGAKATPAYCFVMYDQQSQRMEFLPKSHEVTFAIQISEYPQQPEVRIRVEKVCGPREFVEPGTEKCIVCSQECKSCEETANYCLECTEGLVYDGKCYSTCPDGTFRQGQSCKSCGPNCLRCAADGLCTDCLGNLGKIHGVCTNPLAIDLLRAHGCLQKLPPIPSNTCAARRASHAQDATMDMFVTNEDLNHRIHLHISSREGPCHQCIDSAIIIAKSQTLTTTIDVTDNQMIITSQQFSSSTLAHGCSTEDAGKEMVLKCPMTLNIRYRHTEQDETIQFMGYFWRSKPHPSFPSSGLVLPLNPGDSSSVMRYHSSSGVTASRLCESAKCVAAGSSTLNLGDKLYYQQQQSSQFDITHFTDHQIHYYLTNGTWHVLPNGKFRVDSRPASLVYEMSFNKEIIDRVIIVILSNVTGKAAGIKHLAAFEVYFVDPRIEGSRQLVKWSFTAFIILLFGCCLAFLFFFIRSRRSRSNRSRADSVDDEMRTIQLLESQYRENSLFNGATDTALATIYNKELRKDESMPKNQVLPFK
jgi:hypothetical protein